MGYCLYDTCINEGEMLEVLLDVNMNSYISPTLLLWTMIITTIMNFLLQTFSLSYKFL